MKITYVQGQFICHKHRVSCNEISILLVVMLQRLVN